MKNFIFSFGLLNLLLFLSPLFAQKERDYSIDLADQLTSSEEEKLNKMAKKMESDHLVQILFYTVDALEGRSIEQASLDIANNLAVGFTGVNSGLVLFISEKEQKIRLEVGYGMEWVITDEIAQAVVNKMSPSLKKGSYFNAFKLGYDAIEKILGKESWEVTYRPLSKVRADGDKAEGLIVREDLEKIVEVGEDYVKIELYGSVAAKIWTRPNSKKLFEKAKARDKIYFRLKTSQPLEGYLLGIDY